MSTHSHHPQHHKPLSRFSAKKSVRALNFFCDAPDAKKVSIVGTFNEWKPEAAPMKKTLDGRWMVHVELHHGHHHYLFLADDKPLLDPQAQGVVRDTTNPWAEKVSVIAVS